jgi:FkbM family methyltransferase
MAEMRQLLQRFPRLFAAYQAYRAAKRAERLPTLNPLGFWLVGNAGMQAGTFEPVETRLVQKLLREVDVLVNVGANIGYYCCIALAMKKEVIAFEPMPENVQLLLRNITRNGWQDSLELFPMALGNRHGCVEIFGQGTGASLVKGWAGQSAADACFVALSTLDQVLGERLKNRKCLVLVDVEGAELDMLRGAKILLQADPKPIWMLEVSISEHQPAGVHINPNLVETFELFQERGYSAFAADDALRPVDLAEIRNVAATQRDTLGVHNFIFRASPSA